MTISRDEALKAITAFVENYACGSDLDGLREAIEALKERPNGKWIDESKDALRCSACGKLVYKPFIGGFPTERTQHYNPNYCAFCGADMKEGEKNEYVRT